MSKYKLCKTKQISVVIVEPNKKPYGATIIDSLEAKQKIVEGLIDFTPYDDDVDICFNDEYRDDCYIFNREIRDNEGNYIDYIAGTFFITGKADKDGNSTTLTPEQVDRYIKEFDYPWFDGTKNTKRLEEKQKQIDEIVSKLESIKGNCSIFYF